MNRLTYISTLIVSFFSISSCALVTIPVKVLGEVATTTVGVAGKVATTGVDLTGKVAGAGIAVVTPNKSEPEVVDE